MDFPDIQSGFASKLLIRGNSPRACNVYCTNLACDEGLTTKKDGFLKCTWDY